MDKDGRRLVCSASGPPVAGSVKTTARHRYRTLVTLR